MNVPRKTTIPLIIVCAMLITSQMPDWKYFKDREGNVYFIDQAGKIRITNVKEYHYTPVSARGIDYYLEYGAELIREHRPVEGLSVLKSICALKDGNNRVYQAQVKATKLILRLKKNNGVRFTAMNEDAALMFFSTGNGIEIVNDQMRYSFTVTGPVEVLRKEYRGGQEYRYSGVLFGAVPASGGGESGTYDFLMAVDTEKFAVPYKNLSEAVEKWKGNIGYEGVTRDVLAQGKDRVLYAFHNNSTPRYDGVEGIFVNGAYSHYVRLISSGSAYTAHQALMRRILDGFRMVNVTPEW